MVCGEKGIQMLTVYCCFSMSEINYFKINLYDRGSGLLKKPQLFLVDCCPDSSGDNEIFLIFISYLCFSDFRFYMSEELPFHFNFVHDYI